MDVHVDLLIYQHVITSSRRGIMWRYMMRSRKQQ